MQSVHRQVRLLAACLLLFTVCASAQTVDPRADAKVHVGPFYLTPTFGVDEFGIDTNVFNNDREQRDFTFTLIPHVDVWVPFARRALLTTSATADVVYYQKYSSERSVNPDVRVKGELFLNRITLFAEPSYLRSRQRLNYEIDARADRQEEAVRGGASVRVFRKLSIELAGQERRTRFGADETFNDISLQETLNRDSRTVSATVRAQATPYTTIVVRADRGTDRFEFSPLRDAETVRVMPGVEFNPRALVSGSAYVGFRRFTPASDALEPFSGVVASATLTYTLLGSTRFAFTADRDVTYSYERVQPYFVVDGYGLMVRRQLIGKSDITVGAQQHKYSYRDLLLPGGVPADLDRVDTTRTWLATFGYRIGESMRIGFGASHRQRESNSARFRDYEGFRYATTVDYGF